MRNFVSFGAHVPFVGPQLPVAASLAGIGFTVGELLPTARRRGGDVCPQTERQPVVSSAGGPAPVVTWIDVLGGEPMADARFAKFRSGSDASPLSG